MSRNDDEPAKHHARNFKEFRTILLAVIALSALVVVAVRLSVWLGGARSETRYRLGVDEGTALNVLGICAALVIALNIGARQADEEPLTNVHGVLEEPMEFAALGLSLIALCVSFEALIFQLQESMALWTVLAILSISLAIAVLAIDASFQVTGQSIGGGTSTDASDHRWRLVKREEAERFSRAAKRWRPRGVSPPLELLAYVLWAAVPATSVLVRSSNSWTTTAASFGDAALYAALCWLSLLIVAWNITAQGALQRFSAALGLLLTLAVMIAASIVVWGHIKDGAVIQVILLCVPWLLSWMSLLGVSRFGGIRLAVSYSAATSAARRFRSLERSTTEPDTTWSDKPRRRGSTLNERWLFWSGKSSDPRV